MGVIAGLGAMTFWGTAIFLAAFGARKIGNILTLFWMQLFGFGVALVYFLFNFQTIRLSLTINNLLILIAVAVLQVIAYLSFYKGLEKGEVSLVGPVGATWGLLTALLGVVIFRESLTGTQILAIVLILSGVIALSLDFKTLAKSKELKLLVGVKEGLIAMLGWGISLFLLVIPSKEMGWFVPAFVFRFLVLLILIVYIKSLNLRFVSDTKKFPWALLATIGLFDVGGFFSYSLGVIGESASIVAPIGSAFALVSVLLAKVFLKEKMPFSKSLGIISIIFGLILISV